MAKPWFDEPAERAHVPLYDYITSLVARQLYRDRECVTNMGLYEDREVMGLAPGMFAKPPTGNKKRRSLNVTGALVDTAVNNISQVKPLAMALTEGGNWLQQTKAKRMNKFLEGMYYSLGIFPTMQMSALDMGWGGTGIVYVDREGKKPIVERVFPTELIVDDELSTVGDPYEMTRRKYLPKAKVKRMVAKRHWAAIDKAKPLNLFGTKNSTQQADLIAVFTTWRLPLDEKTPGKKITYIEGATLDCQPYKRDFFPFVFMRWRAQPVGFWGRGIPSLCESLQEEVNRTFRNISRATALAVPRLLLPRESGINIEHLTNEIGSGLWHANGAPPSWLQGRMIPAEGPQHLQFTIAQMYQLAGISELAAGMKKPAGLNSGEAQRVYADTQANRFALPSQQYENASVEISKRLIGVAQDIAEEFGDYEVLTHTTNGFQRIPWSEIDLSEDEYTLKLWPINFLSKSPADMIDQIRELIGMQLLNKKQAKKLVQFPDLEGVLTQDNASEDLTQKIIEEILEHDNYIAPDPAMDPGCVQTVQLARLHYMTIGVPQSKLDMMDDWVANAAMLWPAPPGPQVGPLGAPTMPPGMMPGAGPMPAPMPSMPL
jgi:hypothetical protein